jgi:prolyl-tRNA editing enzyme YbaK/EbsC (Cys-tRNA(Pro) deacylase)
MLQNDNFVETKQGIKSYHYRLTAEETAVELSGYEFNGITPFLMKTSMPVILSDRIVDLSPAYLWFGGGELDLKLGVSVEEFIRVLNPIILDTSK